VDVKKEKSREKNINYVKLERGKKKKGKTCVGE
jgi:hypothetical protein